MQYSFYIGLSYSFALMLFVGYGVWLYRSERHIIQKVKALKSAFDECE